MDLRTRLTWYMALRLSRWLCSADGDWCRVRDRVRVRVRVRVRIRVRVRVRVRVRIRVRVLLQMGFGLGLVRCGEERRRKEGWWVCWFI